MRKFLLSVLTLLWVTGCRPIRAPEPSVPEKIAEPLPASEPKEPIVPSFTPQIVLPQPLVELVPLPASDLEQTQKELENRVNFLGAQIEDLRAQVEKLTNALSSAEYWIKEEGIKLTNQLQQQWQQQEKRLHNFQLEQEKFLRLSEEINKTILSFSQYLVSFQKDLSTISNLQKEWWLKLEKQLAEEKISVYKDLEEMMKTKSSVFMEELTRLVEKTATQQSLLEKTCQSVENLRKVSAEIEKNLAATFRQNYLALAEEIVRQESVLAAMEKRQKEEEKHFSSLLSPALSQLEKQTSHLAQLEKRIAALERLIQPGPTSQAIREADTLLESQKFSVEEEYQRAIEARLAAYARLKAFLEDIVEQESRLAILRAGVGRLEIMPRSEEPFIYHPVKKGETLSLLARKYKTTVLILKELNQLTTDLIVVGQLLKVPLRQTP
ncbi:MAG: LysM peptidoglycan-binding domain-containing protein [Candidatus Omnitrophica bacterium]|nr:LysM peptidoglycan-binding domain-containing protein [Candidatus Omnitrophota bacterium]MCM8769292.1 LysM peptidoglycan-binding domain-containing protein [Candidatus Omnitrophota bacterium]